MAATARSRRTLLGVLAFLICVVLPIGALGVIDWSYTSSVGATQQRTRTDINHGRSFSHTQLSTNRSGATQFEPPRSNLVAGHVGATGMVLVALVLLGLIVLAVEPTPRRVAVATRRSRGPPSYC